MRLYAPNDGLDSMRSDVRQTRAMLKASKVHLSLAKPIDKVLDRWDALDALQRAASDAVTDANALVAWLDLSLDGATRRSVGQLLADTGNNRDHRVFKAFFPEAPGETIRQALESQLDASRHFAAAAEEVGASKAVLAVLKEIAGIDADGRAALKAREEAVLAAARASLKVATWRDDANAVRRGVETALDDHANKSGLSRDYASRFFPAARATAKKPEAPLAPPVT